MEDKVHQYLDLLDSQREDAFSALEGVSEQLIWKRPCHKEWCLGEILDHNYLLIASILPLVKLAWRIQRNKAEKHRGRPFQSEIDDPYRKPSFPMWVGFLWKPRFTPSKPVSLEVIKTYTRDLHAAVREFYSGKAPDMLGNAFLYDPLMGSLNLITTLRVGIYHDQLHYDDVFKLADQFRVLS